MKLSAITPLILTYNEAPNIERTLAALSWAREIVVVDSGSTDETLAILQRNRRVRVHHRAFDTHAAQWNFGLHQTAINTDWVLALDADYVLNAGFVDELSRLTDDPSVAGYRTGFRYCSLGRPLRGGIYPPVVVLYRVKDTRYVQEGHTQRVQVRGIILTLKSEILHDDRKPLERWLRSQGRYADLQAALLTHTRWLDLRWSDRIRRMYVLMPLIAPIYSLLVRRGLLDGAAGLHYALQRAIAETAIALRLLEYRALGRNKSDCK